MCTDNESKIIAADHEHEVHEHDHEHTHSHEHCGHSHTHTHADGTTHTHAHTHTHAAASSPEEALALLKYMLDHNRHHAEELHDLADLLRDCGRCRVVREEVADLLKMAELEVSEKVSARYSTIKEAMEDMSEDEVKVTMQMLFLDFVNPSIGFDILDYFKEVSLLSCDYLLKHADERMPLDEAFNKLETLED